MKRDTTEAPAEPKQPWEMSREEYASRPYPVILINRRGGPRKKTTIPFREYLYSSNPHMGRDGAEERVDAYRKIDVEHAIRDGWPVPSNVLKDYPNTARA